MELKISLRRYKVIKWSLGKGRFMWKNFKQLFYILIMNYARQVIKE